jgi:hypothetical protein
LDRFTPPESQLTTVSVGKPKGLDKTEYSYVDNEEKLNSLMADLADVKLLAVDLEVIRKLKVTFNLYRCSFSPQNRESALR